MTTIPTTSSAKAGVSMQPATPGILAPLYARASDEVLLHIFKFASQNAGTLLALDRTCRRFHRICSEQKLWFYAYQTRFPEWKNGLWYGALPKFSWREHLRQELAIRGRWKEFGRRVHAQIEEQKKARQERLSRILANRVQTSHNTTVDDAMSISSNEPMAAEPLEVNEVAATIAPEYDVQLEEEVSEDEEELDDSDEEIVLGNLHLDESTHISNDPVRQYLCYVADKPERDHGFQPRLTDFLVFDYESEKNGIVACGGYTQSESDYEVLVWSFPNWQLVARIPFLQKHERTNSIQVASEPRVREELLELSWTARVLVTAMRPENINDDDNNNGNGNDNDNDHAWGHICLYDLSETPMRQIDQFKISSSNFSPWVVCALPTSLERSQGKEPIRWQESLQVIMVGIDIENAGQQAYILYYDYQKPPNDRLRKMTLGDEGACYIHFDPHYPSYVVTTHFMGIICLWSAHDGTPLARICLPPNYCPDVIRLTGAMYDSAYSGILSRLVVTTVPYFFHENKSKHILIYNLSHNPSSHGFVTEVPSISGGNSSTDTVDSSDKQRPILVANTHKLQVCSADTSLPIDEYHSYYAYGRELQTNYLTTEQLQPIHRIQGKLIRVLETNIDRATQIQPRGSLLFIEDAKGNTYGLDLEDNEILFKIPFGGSSRNSNNMMLVADDIILLNNYSLSRLAVDRCSTVETLEI